MTVMTVRVPAAIVLAVAPANWTAVKVISLQVILRRVFVSLPAATDRLFVSGWVGVVTSRASRVGATAQPVLGGGL